MELVISETTIKWHYSHPLHMISYFSGIRCGLFKPKYLFLYFLLPILYSFKKPRVKMIIHFSECSGVQKSSSLLFPLCYFVLYYTIQLLARAFLRMANFDNISTILANTREQNTIREKMV